MDMAAVPTSGLRALVFDLFGTVVDWRGSVIAAGEQLGRDTGIVADWAALADAWRGQYQPSMEKVRSGAWPWADLDTLHRRALDGLLADFGITLTEDETVWLNRVWWRLTPWPDSVPGMTALRTRFTLAPLSNGTFAMLTSIAKTAGLPFDCILSAEMARAYKPDPAVYRLPMELLRLPPEAVMLVAAHPDDLRAAQRVGLRTAYVPRPLEWGPTTALEPHAAGEFDCVAADFIALARQFGCDAD